MLGEYINKVLVLVLGYLYPAFECFKSIESTRADVVDLRFWCQYWIIIAIMTAIENLGDIFISWLPLYGESKLAFIIYLWHPKTRGTYQVYDTFLIPFMMQHESNIEKRMQEMLSRTIDLMVFYFKHFVDKGQSMAFQVLDYMLSGSRTFPPQMQTSIEAKESKKKQSNGKRTSFFGLKKRRASPPPSVHPRTLSALTIDDDQDDIKSQVNKVEEALRHWCKT